MSGAKNQPEGRGASGLFAPGAPAGGASARGALARSVFRRGAFRRGAFRRGEPPIAPRAGLIGGLIALVAAAMAFLAVAAAEAGLGADRVAGRWASELSEVATVRVAVPGEDRQAVAVAATKVLEIAPGVAAVRILPEEDIRALLAPWLGVGADVALLPLPVLIDVRLEGGGPDVAAVQRQLDLSAPGAIYDDHGAWRAPLVRGAAGLRWIASGAVALAAVALAAMIAVAAAATLWSGAGVVRTLQLIGAEDRFIARAFERPFALRAALGAAVGALAALLLVQRLPGAPGLDALAADAAYAGPAWWLLAIAPAGAAAIALTATRGAVHYVLRRG